MTTQWWDTLAIAKPLTWSVTCIIGPDLLGWSNSTSDPAQYVHAPRQTDTTIWLPQTTANSPMPMGIYFYGFHQTTSNIRGTHCDISNSRLPNQTIPFHSYP